MICPSRRVSRLKVRTKFTFRQANGKFARRTGMELSKEAMNFGKFSWKINMAERKKAAKKG